MTTDNRRDVIATVVRDVPWGRLMSYRPYSFAERELLQLNNEIPVSLSFYLTDGYGRRLPPLAPQPVPLHATVDLVLRLHRRVIKKDE